MVKVSVIVPVFNAALYLNECLDSILSQDGCDLELICVDDGSTDDSPRMLTDFARRDSRVQTLTQPNSGLGAARNRGLERASGEYMLFVDSDDCLEPGTLKELVGRADAERLDHLLFAARCFGEDGQFDVVRARALDAGYLPPAELCGRVMSGRDLFAALVDRRHFTVSSCLRLMRRAVLEQTQIRFPEGLFFEDNAFTPFALLSASRVAAIQSVFYRRRLHGGSITGNRDWAVRRAADGLAVYVKFLRTVRERTDLKDVQESLGKFVGMFFESCLANCQAVGTARLPEVRARLFETLQGVELDECRLSVWPEVESCLSRLAAVRRCPGRIRCVGQLLRRICGGGRRVS